MMQGMRSIAQLALGVTCGLAVLVACAQDQRPGPGATLEPTAVPSANTTPTVAVPYVSSPKPDSDADLSYARRTPFVPLDNPKVLKAQEATHLADDELILGLEWKGEARAYPVRMLRYHHIVNDTLAGRPFLVTY